MTSLSSRPRRFAAGCIAIFGVLPWSLVAGGCGKAAPTDSSSDSPAAAASGSGSADANAAATYREVYATLGKQLHDAIANGQDAAPMLAQRSSDLDRLVVATRSPRCDFEVDFSAGVATQLPHIAEARSLARALHADAKRLANSGDLDGAAKRVAAIFRMAAHIGKQANSVVELLTAIAMAQLGTAFVDETPALSKAAWKTDIQAAIPMVVADVVDRAPIALQREAAMVAAWLRSGIKVDVDPAIAGVRPRMSAAEREAAAAKLEALSADAAKAWTQPQAATKLAALSERAKREGIDDIAISFERIRKTADAFRASLAATDAALRK